MPARMTTISGCRSLTSKSKGRQFRRPLKVKTSSRLITPRPPRGPTVLAYGREAERGCFLP